jgi:hypothetical protein
MVNLHSPAAFSAGRASLRGFKTTGADFCINPASVANLFLVLPAIASLKHLEVGGVFFPRQIHADTVLFSG